MIRTFILWVGCALFFSVGSLYAESDVMPMKTVYGLKEYVQLDDLSHTQIVAKLDTGATTTSLGATDITYFTRDGEQWVRFKPQIKDKKSDFIEKPLVRVSRIKVRADDNESKKNTKRPVIMMDLCIHHQLYLIEVNLTDRSRFSTPLLLGSKALIQMNAVVDPSLQFTVTTTCDTTTVVKETNL